MIVFKTIGKRNKKRQFYKKNEKVNIPRYNLCRLAVGSELEVQYAHYYIEN